MTTRDGSARKWSHEIFFFNIFLEFKKNKTSFWDDSGGWLPPLLLMHRPHRPGYAQVGEATGQLQRSLNLDSTLVWGCPFIMGKPLIMGAYRGTPSMDKPILHSHRTKRNPSSVISKPQMLGALTTRGFLR